MIDSQHPGTTPPEPDAAADTRPLDVRFPQGDTTPPPRASTTPAHQDRTAAPGTSCPPQPGTTQTGNAQSGSTQYRPPARMSTVVWGLIILVVGVGVVARALGADFDNELALIVLLAAAGLALVATSIVSAARRR